MTLWPSVRHEYPKKASRKIFCLKRARDTVLNFDSPMGTRERPESASDCAFSLLCSVKCLNVAPLVTKRSYVLKQTTSGNIPWLTPPRPE